MHCQSEATNLKTADLNSATISYKVWLWHVADVLGGGKEAAEYRRVALELFLLKCIFDAFW
jgi:hypothetical protein